MNYMEIAEGIRDFPDLSKRTENAIKDRSLWLVPTWRCNRSEDPCDICFASPVMKDAAAEGYLDASPDFFAKAEILSKLPWKHVIITGGEPPFDRQSLRNTLRVIDKSRSVRLVTNGDWCLNKRRREEVLEVIKSSGRNVRVEISDHDPYNILYKKLDTLRGVLSVGVQVRVDGSRESYLKRNSIRDFSGVYYEDRRVLRMGQAANLNESKVLDFEKVVNYTGAFNRGIYLIPRPGGAVAVANHETPYLVGSTPADITEVEETALEVLYKVIDFYERDIYLPERNKEVRLDTVLGYLEAFIRSAVPVDTVRFRNDLGQKCQDKGRPLWFKVEEFAKNLMGVCYESASKRFHVSVDSLKAGVCMGLTNRIIWMLRDGISPRVGDIVSYSGPMLLLEKPPKDQDNFARLIAKGVFREGYVSKYGFAKPVKKVDPYQLDNPFGEYMKRVEANLDGLDFDWNLRILGIPQDQIEESVRNTLVLSR